MKILMVCLGNICRSPLAEGILRTKVEEKNLPWQIDSAGTGAWHVGDLPDPRSIAVARSRGIDLTDQRARQFKKQDFTDFDLIFVMDSSNYQDVMRMAENDTQRDKVKLIMNEAEPGKNIAVPDPYRNDDGFVNVFEMLEQAAEKITENYE